MVYSIAIGSFHEKGGNENCLLCKRLSEPTTAGHGGDIWIFETFSKGNL